MKPINFVLNVIWLLFCGIWMAIGYVVAGVICCVLIVTIPFGIASFRIAGFILWPFGRTTVERPDAGAASCVGNVIWFVFAGWWLAIAHLVTSIPLFLSIIGIPFGWANLKMIPISLMPLGREIVSTDQEWGARY
ncbi:YccF domain-containing protein [Kitasatospora sp. NPDC098652]|uniref:YccF domain-containing protein n=1 Tax=Kitasatospora sp. NPDC098652 TaxID=3364095 RepID=UPI0038073D0D